MRVLADDAAASARRARHRARACVGALARLDGRAGARDQPPAEGGARCSSTAPGARPTPGSTDSSAAWRTRSSATTWRRSPSPRFMWVLSPTYLNDFPEQVAEIEATYLANPPSVAGLLGHLHADRTHDALGRLGGDLGSDSHHLGGDGLADSDALRQRGAVVDPGQPDARLRGAVLEPLRVHRDGRRVQRGLARLARRARRGGRASPYLELSDGVPLYYEEHGSGPTCPARSGLDHHHPLLGATGRRPGRRPPRRHARPARSRQLRQDTRPALARRLRRRPAPRPRGAST